MSAVFLQSLFDCTSVVFKLTDFWINVWLAHVAVWVLWNRLANCPKPPHFLVQAWVRRWWSQTAMPGCIQLALSPQHPQYLVVPPHHQQQGLQEGRIPHPHHHRHQEREAMATQPRGQVLAKQVLSASTRPSYRSWLCSRGHPRLFWMTQVTAKRPLGDLIALA